MSKNFNRVFNPNKPNISFSKIDNQDEFPEPLKSLNLWQLNTNFNVSNKLLSILNKVDGIEGLFKQSRYSASFTVGKLFDELQVKAQITKEIDSYINASTGNTV